MKLLLLLGLLAASLAPSLRAQTDDDALAFLKQHAPEIHAKITSLKDRDPADYRDAMDEAQQAAADHAKIVASGDAAAASAFVKMYAIDFRAITISDAILASNDKAEQERLTAELRGIIDASFEQWAIVEQARVKRLENELANAKAGLEKAIRNRTKVVEEDTAKLIEESRAYQERKKKDR